MNGRIVVRRNINGDIFLGPSGRDGVDQAGLTVDAGIPLIVCRNHVCKAAAHRPFGTAGGKDARLIAEADGYFLFNDNILSLRCGQQLELAAVQQRAVCGQKAHHSNGRAPDRACGDRGRRVHSRNARLTDRNILAVRLKAEILHALSGNRRDCQRRDHG